MKYIVAILGGFVVFIGAFIVVTLVLNLALPSLAEVRVAFGPVQGNVLGIISLFLASIAGTLSFRASLTKRAKTGKLYRKKHNTK